LDWLGKNNNVYQIASMKVTGFSFIRNAQKYDYPVIEAITSILPLCDEFVIAVGNSSDDTLQLIRSIDSPKIKIIETIWDDSLRKSGAVLALETNKAFDAISNDTDWCFYIQGDEVLHEKYLENVKYAMEKYKNNVEVEGLLFKYIHFYGSYEYIADARNWYRREIRIVRKNNFITSYRDAQGFRKKDNSKLKVKLIEAFIYHYGWVKDPVKQQAKQETFHKLWHDNKWVENNVKQQQEFDYSEIDSLAIFGDTHPKVMLKRVSSSNWKFNFDTSKKHFTLKNKFLFEFERLTGWRIGEYKNYKII